MDPTGSCTSTGVRFQPFHTLAAPSIITRLATIPDSMTGGRNVFFFLWAVCLVLPYVIRSGSALV